MRPPRPVIVWPDARSAGRRYSRPLLPFFDKPSDIANVPKMTASLAPALGEGCTHGHRCQSLAHQPEAETRKGQNEHQKPGHRGSLDLLPNPFNPGWKSYWPMPKVGHRYSSSWGYSLPTKYKWSASPSRRSTRTARKSGPSKRWKNIWASISFASPSAGWKSRIAAAPSKNTSAATTKGSVIAAMGLPNPFKSLPTGGPV